MLVLLALVATVLAGLATACAYSLWQWVPSPRAQRRALALAAREYERAGALPLRRSDLRGDAGQPDDRASSAERDLAAELGLDAAAGIDALLPVAEALYAWSTVDEDVYQAVEHISHEHIEGFRDLLTVMSSYQIGAPGLFYKLRGHVGEWQAINHLADLAPAVPLDAANPAYDMLLGGHPVNVKVVGDATATIREHFAQYPDVPLILNADAAHVPADALHFDPAHLFDPSLLEHGDHLVIVDDALTAAGAGEVTHHALATVDHPAGGLHFPWVTLAVSVVVEGRLLASGRTELRRAAKNTALRAGSVGTGAAVGKIAGGALGSLLGPFGTAAGMLAGGVAGSVGGRLLARKAVEAPLRAAREAYRQARAQFDADVERARRYADDAWGNDVLAVQGIYDDELSALTSVERDALDIARENNAIRSHAVVTSLRARVDFVHGRLRTFAASLGSMRFLVERVPPLHAVAQRIAAWEVRLAATHDETALVLLLGTIPSQRPAFGRFVTTLGAVRAAYVDELERVDAIAVAAARGLRERAVAELKQRWARIEAAIAATTAETSESMAAASEAYRVELQRAGKRI